MVITVQIKEVLRKYLHEKIPPDGTELDTNFTDTELNELLQNADNVYAAAAQGWRFKATLSPVEVGQIQKYSIGQETYEKTSASDYVDYCLQMAKMYDEMADKANNMNSSRILNIRRPQIL